MELQDVRVVAEGLHHPEGPVARADGSVLVAEVASGRVVRAGGDGTTSVIADVGGGPNGMAIGPDGALYVCNNSGRVTNPSRQVPAGIQRVDLTNGAVDVLYDAHDGQPLVAPNDLVFDATGAFWFTDMGAHAIYYAQPDGSSIRRADTRASSPNGIGLSPDGDVLYWAETFTRKVQRRRLTAPGEMVASPGCDIIALNRGGIDRWSLVVGLPDALELDSMAIDSSGDLCIGTLVDSGITVVHPQDGSYQRHTLPAQLEDGAVTNICFGGRDLRTAFITCSQTGRLVACRWPRPGLGLAFQER